MQIKIGPFGDGRGIGRGDVDDRVAELDGFDAGAQTAGKILDAGGIVRIHRRLDPDPAITILGIGQRVLGIDRDAIGVDQTVQRGPRFRAD